MKNFHFKLVTPDGVMVDASLWQISASNSLGCFAIRAQHAEIFTSLNPGELILAYSPDKRESIQIGPGFLEFKPECGCTVICEKKL